MIFDERGQRRYLTLKTLYRMQMVQLDERLGSMAGQHVEQQGIESSLFLNHFKVITYLDGTAPLSSDKAAVKAASLEPRLYKVEVTAKKKRSALRLIQLEQRRESLDSNSVFVLNVPTVHTWLWRGSSSNLPNLTQQSLGSSLLLGDEKPSANSKTTMDATVLEQGVNDDERTKFWRYLPRAKDKPFVPTLFKICGDDSLEEVGRASQTPFGNREDQQRLLLPRSLLKGDSAYLLDTGSRVFIWWGLGTVGFDKQWRAFPIAHQYFQDYGRPALPVSVLKQRDEVPSFSKYFHHFTEHAILLAEKKDKENESFFYQIKGTKQKRTLRLKQVPCRRDALNSGDAFVLTVRNEHVWLWRGSSSNVDEQNQGLELAQSFAAQMGTDTIILDQGDNDDEKKAADFWKQLLPGKKKIKEADENDDKGSSFEPILLGVCSGQKLQEVARGFRPFPRSTLTPETTFLLDTGFHVYVWWGHESPGVISDRWKSFPMANQYCRDFKRPLMPITVVSEDRTEPFNFARHFQPLHGDHCCCNIL